MCRDIDAAKDSNQVHTVTTSHQPISYISDYQIPSQEYRPTIHVLLSMASTQVPAEAEDVHPSRMFEAQLYLTMGWALTPRVTLHL